MPDIFDEAAKQEDVFDIAAKETSPGIGELRRREEQGGIGPGGFDVGELRRREGRGEVSAAGPPPARPGLFSDPETPPEGPYTPLEHGDPGFQASAEEDARLAGNRLATAAGIMTVPFTGGISGPATLGRLVMAGAKSGAIQAATEEAVRQITGATKPSVTSMVAETAKGAGIGAAGGVVARAAAPVVAAGAELVAGGAGAVRRAAATAFEPPASFDAMYGPAADWAGPLRADIGSVARRAATVGLRPFYRPVMDSAWRKTAPQLAAEDARAVIQSATGVEVPIGVAEAIGNPGLTARMTKGLKEGAEFSVEDKDALKRLVALSATRLRGLSVSAQDLGDDVVALLQNEVGVLSAPARRAAQEAAAELHPSIQKAWQEVQDGAKALIPGTAATPTTAGKEVRAAVQLGLDELEPIEDAAYAAARASANPETIRVIPLGAQQWSRDVAASTPQFPPTLTSPGGSVPSLMPEGTRKYVEGIGRSDAEWNLQQILNLRSDVGRAIADPTLMPGVGYGRLQGLYRELSSDIEATLNALPPDVGAKWQAAWALTREKAARFKGTPVEKILDEFGQEGGHGPAAIASKLESADGWTVVQTLKTAAGPTFSPQIDQTVKQYLFNQAGQRARNATTGELSVDGMVRYVEGLAPEMRQQYFPNLAAVKALAQREAAVAGVKTASKDILKNLSVSDPVLLEQALGQKPAKDVMAKLQTAFAAEAQREAAFKGSVLAKLKTGAADDLANEVAQNPTRFVRSITDGTFGIDNTRKALDLIRNGDPLMYDQLQFHFVDNLLSSYSQTAGRGINANLLTADLAKGTSTKAAADIAELSETVLGPAKMATLKDMLKAFAELDKQGGQLTLNSPLVDVSARGVGGILGLAVGKYAGVGPLSAAYQANWFASHGAGIKHALASYLLTTQELRKLAMTPISAVSRDQARKMMKGFTAYMVDKVADGSPEAEELREIEAQADR